MSMKAVVYSLIFLPTLLHSAETWTYTVGNSNSYEITGFSVYRVTQRYGEELAPAVWTDWWFGGTEMDRSHM